jgi:hypothetical protein
MWHCHKDWNLGQGYKLESSEIDTPNYDQLIFKKGSSNPK